MRDSKTNQYKSSSLETIVMQMLLSKLLLTVDFGNFSLCSKIKLNTDIIKLLHEFDNKKKKYIYIYIYIEHKSLLMKNGTHWALHV